MYHLQDIVVFGDIVVLGIAATAVMDVWGLVRKPLLGVPAPNYGLVGRWVGHMARGTWRHDAIKAASPVAGELVLGWTVHYLTGIAFAAILVCTGGVEWLRNPTIAPALMVGVGTIAAPFLLMQPGMGAGIAGSRLPNPGSARIQSLVTHLVFGLGLYVSGIAWNAL